MASIAKVASLHMAAGVMDLEQLALLCEQETGRAPSLQSLADYRTRFLRHGAAWLERRNDASKQWKARNPEQNSAGVLKATRRWEAANPAMKLLNTCRKNAKRRGQECTITADDIKGMLAPMTCAASGLPLTRERGDGSARNPWAPSVDRIDNSKGYVPGNVRIVCAIFNMMRADWADDALLRVVKALAENNPD